MHRRLRGRRGHGREGPDRGGGRHGAARSGPPLGRHQGRGHAEVELRIAASRRRLPQPALRRVRRKPRRLGPRGRALHHGAGHALHVVAQSHGGRAHQPLGPHLPALRTLGLQGPEPRRRRRRLAHLVRRPEAVLRQARSVRRALRVERGTAQRPRRDLHAAARAPGLRAAHQEILRHAEGHVHPLAPFDPHEAPERAGGLPLLRPVRARLLDALELLEPVGPAPACIQDRQADPRDRGDGPRGVDEQRGSRHRCLLHRHRRRAGRRRSAPGSWSWPRVPASRRASS